ncbi:MAG: hypothetical protein J7L35_01400, partial [Anaerolineales bacterium]|nr:hypothetical protein [Anaerolineales bacterium]
MFRANAAGHREWQLQVLFVGAVPILDLGNHCEILNGIGMQFSIRGAANLESVGNLIVTGTGKNSSRYIFTGREFKLNKFPLGQVAMIYCRINANR